jgi:hypothetical protein
VDRIHRLRREVSHDGHLAVVTRHVQSRPTSVIDGIRQGILLSVAVAVVIMRADLCHARLNQELTNGHVSGTGGRMQGGVPVGHECRTGIGTGVEQ